MIIKIWEVRKESALLMQYQLGMRNKAASKLIASLLMLNFLTVLSAKALAQNQDTEVWGPSCEMAQFYRMAPKRVEFNHNDYPMIQQLHWQKNRGHYYPSFYTSYEHGQRPNNNPSNNKLIPRDEPVLSALEKRQLLEEADRLHDKAEYACCRNDFSCKGLFSKLKIEFCDAKDYDCYESARGAFILYSDVRKLNLLRALKFTSKLERPDDFEDKFKKIIGVSISEFEAENKSLREDPRRPLSGVIEINPYKKHWQNGFPHYLFYHELGHACSYIRKQSFLFRGSSTSRSNVLLDLAARHVGKCEMSTETQKTYKAIARPEFSTGAIDCLVRMAKSSTNQNSQAYINGACQNTQLEEAFAQAFSLMSIPSEAAFSRSLVSVPSSDHPKMGQVFKCLMTYQGGFQSRMENYLCKPEPR